MTEEELIQIEKRCRNSTKGNWIAMIEGMNHESGSDFIMNNVNNNQDYNNPERGEDIELLGGTMEDIIFIANAKQDILNLIAEIRKLRTKSNESNN
jgi:hypothetical protein